LAITLITNRPGSADRGSAEIHCHPRRKPKKRRSIVAFFHRDNRDREDKIIFAVASGKTRNRFHNIPICRVCLNNMKQLSLLNAFNMKRQTRRRSK